MEPKVYNFTLDIKENKPIEYIEVSVMDRLVNKFIIKLEEKGADYSVDGSSVTIIFKKADNNTVIQSTDDTESPIEIIDNLIHCTLKPNSYNAVGRILAEVIVKSPEGQQLAVSRFIFYSRGSLLNDGMIESTVEFPLLDKMLKEWRGFIDEYGTVSENERQRDLLYRNMVALKSNLEGLEASIGEKELIRESNERIREQLKDELITLESEVSDSIDRANQSATNADSKAQEANTALESINDRILSINTLISKISQAEDERISNESARVLAETERANTFTQKISGFETESSDKINDFIAETERVESQYPVRLTNVENDLIKKMPISGGTVRNFIFPPSVKWQNEEKENMINVLMSDEFSSP